MPSRTWTKFESTNLKEAEYDRNSEKLTVVFQTGATYSYDQVPERIFNDLLAAPSKGSYFCKCIRTQFPYRRL